MFRLLGFLIGSAVSVITILLIVGIPEFHVSNPQLDKRRFDEAVEKLREKTQELKTEIIAEQREIETANPETDPEPMAAEIAEAESTLLPPVSDVPQELTPQQLPAPTLEPQWHPFWSPFRSRIAADGFIAQLEKVTGLDYRVVKVDTGVYQVAFSYADDSQRQVFLSQISSATGLEFPGT